MKHSIRARVRVLSVLVFAALGSAGVSAEEFRLRIASGHPAVATYVKLMNEFFVPEVTARVAARTKHKVSFVEGYGGSMIKVTDTLEGVQSGIIDVGGYCFCFEPSNLPLHAFQAMLPFGPMEATKSLKVARAVYDQVPYMSKVFEDKYNQKLLALIADNGYNLGTSFPWKTVADLKNHKIAGAGLNLKWLEYAGAVPVTGTLPEAYTSLQTGVFDGWIMYPSAWIQFKLYEVNKYYTEIAFGSITWHGLTMNKAKFSRLPKDVQDIIVEVAREYETKTGTVNEADYPRQLEHLKELGALSQRLPDSVRADWAKSLQDWPQSLASELDQKRMPASQVLKLTLQEAEKVGHKWPVRYPIK